MNIEELKFNDDGLLPVIIQDFRTGQILMFAYTNAEALKNTVETGLTHFWSRSRQQIWNKGEESGNIQKVKQIFVDCDKDTILITVEQTGVACHTGEQSCFYTNFDSTKEIAPSYNNSAISKVFNIIEDRKVNPREDSYVNKLLDDGTDKILKKIGEEAGETIIAAKNETKKEFIYEITDLWFHSLVLLSKMGLSPEDINRELERRFGKKKSDYTLD
ncbi:MAG: bifunctional phosphoribosyl-AMP cyclohydrolase/phosphoribosyl-ATP diphosphatase HisIE [Thermodesulfobacteriota bacterium]